MMGCKVDLNYPPRRIVSLVPSQSELLADLGLADEVIGITKFCVHPEQWFRSKRRVGGTKSIHIDIVKELQPDLIIANKEENTKEQIEELSGLFPTWTSDIKTIADALVMIRNIGALTGTAEKAHNIANEIQKSFADLKRTSQPKRVAYFIWRDPWMCAGGDTFINDMICNMGWTNVLADKMRYPEIPLEELKKRNPEIILLSSEPYPFKDKHIAEIKNGLPGVDVKLVDGEMMSWYGSRMLHAAGYLASLCK